MSLPITEVSVSGTAVHVPLAHYKKMSSHHHEIILSMQGKLHYLTKIDGVVFTSEIAPLQLKHKIEDVQLVGNILVIEWGVILGGLVASICGFVLALSINVVLILKK